MFEPKGRLVSLVLKHTPGKSRNCAQGIVLGTAHPAKFAPVVERVKKADMGLPSQIVEILNKKGRQVYRSIDFQQLKVFLLSRKG